MAKKRNAKELKKIEEAQERQHFAYAAELSRRYVAAYPDDLEGKWLNGLSLFYLDRNNEAKRQLEEALPHFSDDFRGAALTFLARIQRRLGDRTNAERYYLQAIEADPQDSDNFVELATELFASNRLEEAIALARKGIEAGASPLEDLHGLLVAFYRSTGDIVKAAESLSQVEQDDEEVEAAVEDFRLVADLLGIELPKDELSSDQEEEGDEEGESEEEDSDSEEEQHEPGKMALNIHREFFVKILSGEKKIEYRAFTPYWQTRIDKAGPPPFHLRVINGMLKNAPELTVVVKKVLINPWAGEYELHLGDVIDVKNWDRENQVADEE